MVKDFLPFLCELGEGEISQSADVVDRVYREKLTHLLDSNVDVVTSITLVISR